MKSYSSKYGDFHTIDWQRDLARDRLRHKMIEGRSRDFPLGLLKVRALGGPGLGRTRVWMAHTEKCLCSCFRFAVD